VSAGVRVWDPLVRVAHWTLVTGIVATWITAELESDPARRAHEWIGYAVLAVIALRVVWGWAGTHYARFSEFVHGPAHTLAYARSVAVLSEPRYLGHNPLGGWMVVALLAMAAAAGLSGWLSVSDRFWGVKWVQELHEALANTLYALAGLHVAGVIYTSVRHRENLVRAMFTGRKRAT
jgi:cytochrome b